MYSLLNLKKYSSKSGDLIILEQPNSLPFLIKRSYFILNTHKKKARGFHAHKKLKQIIIALTGSVEIIIDDGKNKETIVLDNPTKALHIHGLVWREIKNFDNCILNVLCDSVYSEDDYIRDYDEFLKLVNK